MPSQKLFEHVESPLVRAFLRDNLCEFVNDVCVFSEQVLANMPVENRPSVKNAGLVFYGAPIASLVPGFPWETVKAAIATGISDVFPPEAGGQGTPEEIVPSTIEKNAVLVERIEQAIIMAFAELHKSAGSAIGMIVIGGVASVLGKYVALYIAGILDEAAGSQVNAARGATAGACAQACSAGGGRLERLIRNAAGNACQGDALRE